MITITLKIFPLNRRASFSSVEVQLNDEYPTVKDIYKACVDIKHTTHKIARGISFLNMDDPIKNKDNLNVIPF